MEKLILKDKTISIHASAREATLVDANVWEPGTEGTDSLWKLIR
ncbi:hypothetical protein [Bacteroides acidifaciens]|nr:hypothetical protein [Bacteroides acidifaciens]